MVQNYASHVKTVMITIEKKDERHNRGKIKDEWYLTRKMEN